MMMSGRPLPRALRFPQSTSNPLMVEVPAMRLASMSVSAESLGQAFGFGTNVMMMTFVFGGIHFGIY